MRTFCLIISPLVHDTETDAAQASKAFAMKQMLRVGFATVRSMGARFVASRCPYCD